ncbi:hypothetical protein BGW39_005181 [Mortierella sp. 14UC]|nr:hypothetical protein BGW39_005181 [Mortierella sp. 14UC]
MSDTITAAAGATISDTNSSGTGTPQAQTQSSSPSATTDNKTDQPAHHVIFVVHGMGRQLEVPFGNYEKNECTRTVLQSQFHELETNVHIIPIEWHAKLHSMVDERMALASLRTVPKVRLVMNDYMADILYYFNPHFGTQIVRMIVDELNEAYDLFLEKHPDFNGKISVYALSLGGVAMFDILTCQDDDDAEEEQSEASTAATGNPARAEVKTEETKEGEKDCVQEPPTKKARVRKQDQPKFRAVIPKLKFRPEYLFTVGSPVGAVMVMRNLDWETFHPPDDIIHHNLFHPFDPLGYRLEPLIDPVFAGVPAAIISSYQSQLFPSLLSLPSLPSLQLPESISAFWENRVPTLPRPSIPTLSSISSMTQSLKAGRWLPGSGSNATSARADEEGHGGSNSTSDSEEEDGEDIGANVSAAAEGDTDRNVSSSVTSVSDADEAKDDKATTTEKDESRSNNWEPESMMDGGDASVSEFMGAATAATYLELQSEDASTSGAGTSGGRQADVAAIKAQNDTTTESPQKGGRQPPARRPSLGPRRISSRVEEDVATSGTTAAGAAESKRAMMDVAEENYLSATEEGGASVTTTAQEKALGVGAKSDVIQESIVRSMPEGSSSASTSNADDTKVDTEESNNATTTKKTVHVEGKATKLPYRIDHVLQETTVDQYTNEYLLGMRSHFKYWANKDVAYHILRTLLEPVDPEAESKVLDLKLSMPVPVSTTNGAKEAAEAKAKAASMAAAAGSSAATTRARSGTLGSIASDAEANNSNKKQNRMSFSFSFFGGQSSTNSSSDDLTIQQQLSDEQERLRKRRQRREEEEEEGRGQREQGQVDGDFEMMDEEGELFGYQYSSDLDMVAASRASVGWTRGTGSGSKSFATTKVSRTSAKTLFQSSPWSKKQGGGEAEVVESSHTRTMSTTSTERSSGSKKRISVERTSSSSTSVAVASTSTSALTSSEEEESAIVEVDVPELARPAKLHHRAARVEE